MMPLKNSPLASYFDECSEDDLASAQVLSAPEAREVWGKYFSSKARSLYELPDDSWVAQASWSMVGSWIDAYNATIDTGEVSRAMSAATNWASDEPLLFVQGSTQIVALDFHCFKLIWRGLLAAFDDGPILINRGEGQECIALRFVPMGQILSFKGFKGPREGSGLAPA